MPKKLDLIGERFERWYVVAKAPSIPVKGGTRACWKCVCDCGIEGTVRADQLRSGKSNSCGCYQKEKASEANTDHGMYKSKIYDVWRVMVARCTRPSHKLYHRYGGRGITVCQEWEDFNNFYKDMGGNYQEGLEIERTNNNLGYCKENCKWDTRRNQVRNKSNNVNITFRGKTQCLSDWANELGIVPSAMRARIQNWSLERALTLPKQK